MTKESGAGNLCCRDCRYFIDSRCRRLPPVLVGYRRNWEWPLVEATDWCGEWWPREENAS